MPSNAVTVASNAFNKAEKALEEARERLQQAEIDYQKFQGRLRGRSGERTRGHPKRRIRVNPTHGPCTRFVIASSAKDLASDLQTKGPWMEGAFATILQRTVRSHPRLA